MALTCKQVLEAVQAGRMSVDEAVLKLKIQPFEDINFAKIDLHRKLRQGATEVIFGEQKTAAQMAAIVDRMQHSGQDRILITRLDASVAAELCEQIDLTYHPAARLGLVGQMPKPDGIGQIVVATGGTSDLPVAEEAALTAEMHGNVVVRLYDVGVAGLHRLLAHLESLMTASVVIAVAGMEGALPSVIGGLVDCPVIAVPTSVGYGTAFGGVTALLSMLNACASGMSVVNIDNGFGAGFLASRINHMGQ